MIFRVDVEDGDVGWGDVGATGGLRSLVSASVQVPSSLLVWFSFSSNILAFSLVGGMGVVVSSSGDGGIIVGGCGAEEDSCSFSASLLDIVSLLFRK